MNNSKKMLCFVLVVLLSACAVFATGTSETKSASTSFPNGKAITIMCGFGAGGVNDLACRVIAPYLGKALNTNVEVQNMPGAGGWVQVLDLVNNTSADGYIISIWADGMQFVRHSKSAHYDVGIDNMTSLGSYASDTCSLACSPKETRWTDVNSLIEYAKSNVVTVSVTALEGEDYIPIAKMNAELGTHFEAVLAVDGATQGIANVMGGHVDIVSDNIASLNNYINDGSLKGLAVFSPERTAMWPDVPSFVQATGLDVNFANTRGMVAPAGLDPEVQKILVEAFKTAVTDPECIKELRALGLNTSYLTPDEFYQKNLETEKVAIGVADSLGWGWY